jgi:hypothetical protein
MMDDFVLKVAAELKRAHDDSVRLAKVRDEAAAAVCKAQREAYAAEENEKMMAAMLSRVAVGGDVSMPPKCEAERCIICDSKSINPNERHFTMHSVIRNWLR